MTRTSRTTRASLLASLGAALLLGLTACAGGSGGSGGSDTAASEESLVDSGLVEGEAPGAADGRGLAYDVSDSDAEAAGGSVTGSTGRTGAGQESTTLREPSIISTGTVSLRADDVAEARFEVQKVVDRLGGQVTDSETSTDEDGAVRDARLVLRVPSEDFTEAMDELEGLADLEASSTSSEDVTTQVVDTEVRIRIQRESIARIEALLARAGTIQAVVSVERELSRREADLNSLLQQQAYLADRTSLSTITVHLQRHAEDGGPDEDDDSGFLAGLEKGWDGFTTVVVGLATVTGAVLPFAAAGLLVGVPAWLLLRGAARRRRTSPAAAPGPATAAEPTEG